MNMYISSKVTHAKYAVAETRIPSVKQITAIPVLTTANYVFLH